MGEGGQGGAVKRRVGELWAAGVLACVHCACARLFRVAARPALRVPVITSRPQRLSCRGYITPAAAAEACARVFESESAPASTRRVEA